MSHIASLIPSQPPDSALALQPIGGATQANRWRTEAMRSHATPRLLFIARGQGRIIIQGLTHGYFANNLIYIPARTMYGFEAGPTVFGHLLTLPRAMASEWPSEAVHLRLRDVMAQKEFLTLFDGLERELSSDRQHARRAAHYQTGLLAVFFARQIDNQRNTGPDVDRRNSSAARLVAAYTDLIERHFPTDKGIADYAATLGVTATHLTRCCRQTSGQSALTLLSDRRHYEACRMLRETRAPIADVAQVAGYGSAAYFSRVFQARAGQTPSAFRKSVPEQRRAGKH
ncbi:AraC-type DNA-binding protein [Loktanella sp. DSM 29012]|uniref:AraC family transcriptional regulator n=1 Tax=Loktanella gaetbuli TaxID=2881335 RepID=A0ABS8BPY9_9RHOB|nr:MULTISPECIES: AraC family transcriptional regulator [Loktanella]MCB5197780.1 AraC family transcriptional regulator [Loktanella gaetbuli]SEQ14949.1 AraC-type DNA-binding protein [Loktanella sp. DSM 29012]